MTSATYCTSQNVKERIEKIVKGSKVVVFMKGTPDAPRCGFSNGVMQILKFHGVENFDAHNVLEDDEVRQGKLMVFCQSNGGGGTVFLLGLKRPTCTLTRPRPCSDVMAWTGLIIGFDPLNSSFTVFASNPCALTVTISCNFCKAYSSKSSLY
jgi:hypothetical protein